MNKISKINLTLRWSPFALAVMLLFATLIAQPTQAATNINTIKCNSITLFGTTSSAALQLGATSMQKTFELQLNVMQSSWQLEDIAVNALRQIGESSFIATLNAFANRPGIFVKQTEFRTAAVDTYKKTLLDALHLHQTNIDAARAAYREDMLALVKAHQEVLTNLVNNLIKTVNDAVATAKRNCSQERVVATLVAVIAKANATLLTEALKEDARAFGKALQLVTTRNKAYAKEEFDYIKTGVDATSKLAQAFITRQ